MANYYCHCRTNYFKVTDVEALKALVEKIPEAELWEKNGAFGFGGNGDISQYYPPDILDENGDYVGETDPLDVVSEIQKLLPDGEVFIAYEVGHERLRYVTGSATVATNKEVKYLDLQSLANELATKMSGNPELDIYDTY